MMPEVIEIVQVHWSNALLCCILLHCVMNQIYDVRLKLYCARLDVHHAFRIVRSICTSLAHFT